MIEKNKNWMKISVGALVLSFGSLFLPVVLYNPTQHGTVHAFPLLKLLDGESFVQNVLSEYRGSFLYGMSEETANMVLLLLSVIGIAAIVLSFVGLKSMSKQYESIWPFVLTILGIVCTAIPAVALLIAVSMSGDGFTGTLRAGLYAYVTPAAMIISCITVTRRHKLTREELNVQKLASEFIRPAGDLPLQ